MMRLKIIAILFSLIYVVSGRNHVKTLTESHGQEVIEIGTPIKELPVGLEEEPGAEEDDDVDEKDTSQTPAKTQMPATKKESKKTTTLASVKKDATTEVEKTEELNQDEDEARIEKELAEIYKDTADYKTDTSEEKEVAKEAPATVVQTTEETTYDGDDTDEDSDKPIGRQRGNFRFQPESQNAADIERFRTSVDEISCNNRQQLKGTATTQVGRCINNQAKWGLHPSQTQCQCGAPSQDMHHLFNCPSSTTTCTTHDLNEANDKPVQLPLQQSEDSKESKKLEQSKKSDAFHTISNGMILITAMLSYVFICI